jgi:hypothetical protein
MKQQMGLERTLAISKHDILRCLIGKNVCDAYNATVQDDENSYEDFAEEKD